MGGWGLVTPICGNAQQQQLDTTVTRSPTICAGTLRRHSREIDSARNSQGGEGEQEPGDRSTPSSRNPVGGNLINPSDMEFRPSFRGNGGESWNHSIRATTGNTPRGSSTGGSAGRGLEGTPGTGAGEGRARSAGALSRMEAALANECLVSLLAAHGTANRFATGPQIAAALRREGFPDASEALALLKDPGALRGRGVKDRLWRGRRTAALVRTRVEESVFGRLPPELFRHVLPFLAS